MIATNRVVREWWAQEEKGGVYVPGFIDSINNAKGTMSGEYLDKITA